MSESQENRRREMEATIEAILFVAHDPVPRRRILESYSERRRALAEEALDAVIQRYNEAPERGIMIDEVAGGLRLVTRPDLHDFLRRFFESSSTNKLTMPALETLSIIAYRQPVTAPEVQELRGVGSMGVIKKLLERRLIRVAGRKEVVGKPFLYATTREFLMHFGLKSLKDLPPLEQFEELFGEEIEAMEGVQVPVEPEEQVDREAAALAEAEDDAASKAEADAIEREREAAEEEEAVDEAAPADEPADALDEPASEDAKIAYEDPVAVDLADVLEEAGAELVRLEEEMASPESMPEVLLSPEAMLSPEAVPSPEAMLSPEVLSSPEAIEPPELDSPEESDEVPESPESVDPPPDIEPLETVPTTDPPPRLVELVPDEPQTREEPQDGDDS